MTEQKRDAYRIEKFRKEVTLIQDQSKPKAGMVFLSASTKHQGPQRVIDLLCDQRAFFPFEELGGKIHMIKKTSVRKVIVDSEFELEVLRTYGPDAYLSKPVKIAMRDGNEEEGQLLIEAKEGSRRAQDEVNRNRDFVLLEIGDFVHLVGTRFISSLLETNE